MTHYPSVLTDMGDEAAAQAFACSCTHIEYLYRNIV